MLQLEGLVEVHHAALSRGKKSTNERVLAIRANGTNHIMRIELMATLAVQIDHALLQWLGYHVGKLVVERGR